MVRTLFPASPVVPTSPRTPSNTCSASPSISLTCGSQPQTAGLEVSSEQGLVASQDLFASPLGLDTAGEGGCGGVSKAGEGGCGGASDDVAMTSPKTEGDIKFVLVSPLCNSPRKIELSILLLLYFSLHHAFRWTIWCFPLIPSPSLPVLR